jgi:hypothetical protein
MKQLKNCIKLSCQVKIYVPSTVDVNKSFDSSEWIEKAMSELSSYFGGSTSSKALGAWISGKGDLVKEDVTVVFSYATQAQLEINIDKVYEFCLEMKKELLQESIALEVNGELYLV